MGIGDWGLGIGDWGLGSGPNPQSPIPNPQSPSLNFKLINLIINDVNNKYNYYEKIIYIIIKYQNVYE